MKKHILVALISFLLLSGCASTSLPIRQDVALSSDLERIAYHVTGQQTKTTLIFVHGWSCDSRYWQKQIPVFAKDYQVIALDLAGHGHSSLDRSEFSMQAFANDIKAIMDQEGIERAILIGHSMAGVIIAEAAKLMPTKIVGIIGVDTLQNVGESIPQSVLDQMLQPFMTHFKDATKDFVSPMFPENTDQQLLHWVKEDMSSAPKTAAVNAFRNYLQMHVNGEAALVFKDLTLPVISINSRLWPTAQAENSKYIKNYQLFYIEETGHFPMLEKPAKFNQLLKKAISLIEKYTNEK
ncbi:Pimeloyl-ACP methyl ester carboxylesterase [Allopseudospirillum japonicum]|uniref:Pimeloyl-ACP methyl ester carboxylesterase n=1 Tax=Allopseudospirillum japonicum TaxID=64971 RepID=A0A1H6S8J1_9GAMM|nr:alpha/beta fold hydrolase [Allopseudospirillum japonicum]SEI64353.1 Pimeloyl-ACP methyl ester carboxylesterase [Allopseudospirillum japonicum]